MKLLKKTRETLGAGFRTLLPTCRQAARLQSEALDHPLTPARRFGLRLHLLFCKWCRRYGSQIRFVKLAVGSRSDKLVESGPQRLSDEARERIKQKLRAATE